MGVKVGKWWKNWNMVIKVVKWWNKGRKIVWMGVKVVSKMVKKSKKIFEK